MKRKQQLLFGDTQEDLPLFSGTCQRVRMQVFNPPEEQTTRLPGLDEPPDWLEMIANRTKIIRPKKGT